MAVGLVFGLVIGMMVVALRPLSGAHFNPAVTVALTCLGRSRLRNLYVYVPAQLAGAVCASLLLRALVGTSAHLGATVPTVGTAEALLVEVLATFFLMFMVAIVAERSGISDGQAGATVGAAVAMGALFAGPATGGSMNPARSFGPAVAALLWTDHWLYWAGPMLGALAAAGTYRVLFPKASASIGGSSPPQVRRRPPGRA